MHSIKYTYGQEEGILEFSLKGNFCYPDAIHKKYVLYGAVKNSCRGVLLNCTEMHGLDDVGREVLKAFRDFCRIHKMHICIVNFSDRVRKMIENAGLSEAFRLFSDMEEAVRYLREGPLYSGQNLLRYSLLKDEPK